jgi:hypothetical protein
MGITKQIIREVHNSSNSFAKSSMNKKDRKQQRHRTSGRRRRGRR